MCLVVLLFEALIKGFRFGRLSFQQRDRFGKRPTSNDGCRSYRPVGLYCFPADELVPLTRRQYDKKCPTDSKRLMSWISYSIVIAKMRPDAWDAHQAIERVGVIELGVLLQIKIESP